MCRRAQLVLLSLSLSVPSAVGEPFLAFPRAVFRVSFSISRVQSSRVSFFNRTTGPYLEQLQIFVAGNFSRVTNRDYSRLAKEHFEKTRKKKKKKENAEELEEEEDSKQKKLRKRPTAINPCGKEWNAGDLAYKCRDCQRSTSSSVCAPCFRESDHVGHDFTIYRSEAGGVCDCGDYESWASSGCCLKHGGTSSSSRAPADEENEEEEEEDDEVWDSTSEKRLLRVRKKERRMSGAELFTRYWLNDDRRKFRTAIALDIAVRRLVLAVKNTRRLKVRYAELTQTVRFREDANSSFGEFKPMDRADGMVFTEAEKRYVVKKVAPYVISNENFPYCFLQMSALTEEEEQRWRREAFRSASNRAMLLNERVPRALLEQLEEISVASSVLAGERGEDRQSTADDAEQLVRLDPKLEKVLSSAARRQKLENMRDEFRVIVERIQIERTAARVIANWLVREFADSEIVEVKECLATAFITSCHRLASSSSVQKELEGSIAIKQMWRDVAHVHVEIESSMEEWLEDVSIRTRGATPSNAAEDEKKGEKYENWGRKKWKNCWYGPLEGHENRLYARQLEANCMNSPLFVIMHEMSETPDAEVYSDIVSIFLKLIVSSAFVQMYYAHGKSESYGQNRFECHSEFESLSEFRTHFFKVYMHLYFDLCHVGFMFPWSSLKPSSSSECFRGRRKFDRIRADLLDRIGVQLFASWSLFCAVNDSIQFGANHEFMRHYVEKWKNSSFDMFQTHRRLLWTVKVCVDEDLRNILKNPTWHVDHCDQSVWAENTSLSYAGLASRPISDMRTFALNSTLNSINFMSCDELLFEFFEEMFIFGSNLVEPVIRAHKNHVGRENEDWFNIVALEYTLVQTYSDILHKALLDPTSYEHEDEGDGVVERRHACAEHLRLRHVLKFLKARVVSSCKRTYTAGVEGSRNELDARNPHAPHLRCFDITIHALYDYYSRNSVPNSNNVKEIITRMCEDFFRNDSSLDDDSRVSRMFNHVTAFNLPESIDTSMHREISINCSEIIALRVSDILHWSFQVNARAWILNGDQMRLYSHTYSYGNFKFVSKSCDVSLFEKVLTFSPRKSVLFAVEIFLLRVADIQYRWINYDDSEAECPHRSHVELIERHLVKEIMRESHSFPEMRIDVVNYHYRVHREFGSDALLKPEKVALCLRDAMNILASFAFRQSQSDFCIATERERLENSIIHTVALKESPRTGPTYSNIQSRLSLSQEKSLEEKSLDDYLEHLCVVRKPPSLDQQSEAAAFSMQVTYELKEELWSKFNAFHIDYTDEERETAKSNAIRRNSEWTPISESSAPPCEFNHSPFKFRFSVSPVVAYICSLCIRLAAFNKDRNPIYDDLAVAAFVVLDDAMRNISSQLTTSSRSELLKNFDEAIDTYIKSEEDSSEEDGDCVNKLKVYAKACDEYFNKDLEILKDGFNSSTIELFSKLEEAEPAFSSHSDLPEDSNLNTRRELFLAMNVPKIPDEIRASEIEVIRNWSKLWNDYASAKKECVEFIKYLTYDKSVRLPCCSELGSDSLKHLIRELEENVAIWKEENRGRELRDGHSSFCGAMYLLATRQERKNSNEDILRRTAIKVANRMRKNDHLCLLDAQTYNDIARQTGAFAGDGPNISSSNERGRDGNNDEEEKLKLERKARLKARQEQLMREMHEQQQKASQALGISEDDNNSEEDNPANCVGCGNAINKDDSDACIIAKFMLVNHADVLKRNEFDRRIKQSDVEYDRVALKERMSRFDGEFADIAHDIMLDTCLSVETGGLIAQTCGHKMHLKCLRKYKIATGAQETGQAMILKKMQGRVFVEGANIFGESEAQNDANNRTNVATLEDDTLENSDDDEQERDQLLLEENTLRANGEDRRRQVLIRREGGLVDGQFHCPACRRVSDCAIPILEQSKSSREAVDLSDVCNIERALLERELVESIFCNLASVDYGGTTRFKSFFKMHAESFVFLHPSRRHHLRGLDINDLMEVSVRDLEYEGDARYDGRESDTLLATRRDYNALWKCAIAGICFAELAMRPNLSLTATSFAREIFHDDADEVNTMSIDATWWASMSLANLAFAFTNFSSRASCMILHHHDEEEDDDEDEHIDFPTNFTTDDWHRFKLYRILRRLDLHEVSGFSWLFSEGHAAFEEKICNVEWLERFEEESGYSLNLNRWWSIDNHNDLRASGAMEVMHFPSSRQTMRYQKRIYSSIVYSYLGGESVWMLKKKYPDQEGSYVPEHEKFNRHGIDLFLKFVHTMLWCFETIRTEFSKSEEDDLLDDTNYRRRESWPPTKFLEEDDIREFLTRLRVDLLKSHVKTIVVVDEKKENVFMSREDLEYLSSIHFRMGALIEAVKISTKSGGASDELSSGRIKMPRKYDIDDINRILSCALDDVFGSKTHPELTLVSCEEIDQIWKKTRESKEKEMKNNVSNVEQQLKERRIQILKRPGDHSRHSPDPNTLKTPSLIKPPKRHEDLLLASKTPCKCCQRVPEVAAMCLLCGDIFCAADEFCSPLKSSHRKQMNQDYEDPYTEDAHDPNTGERDLTPFDVEARNHYNGALSPLDWGLYKHARSCGQRTCVFILPHLTKTLILDEQYARLCPSLYVDSRGEEDENGKRGVQLFLVEERFNAINNAWRTGALVFQGGSSPMLRGQRSMAAQW